MSNIDSWYEDTQRARERSERIEREEEEKKMGYDPELDHYKQQELEPIDVIETYHLGFNLGNVVKYVLRAPFKGNYVGDLEKALWYIAREIRNAEEKGKAK